MCASVPTPPSGRRCGQIYDLNTSIRFTIRFTTPCKPCCFKAGHGTIATDGRSLEVNASSTRCVRLATGRVYSGADNFEIKWEAHSPEGTKAAWKNWVKAKT